MRALSERLHWEKLRTMLARLTKDHHGGGHSCEVHVHIPRGADTVTLVCISREHWEPVTLRAIGRADLDAMGLLK